MSVVGFDDIPLAAAPQLSLTTIRSPAMEMGSLAVARLTENLGTTAVRQTTRLATTLVVRGSTAPPPGAQG
jgi:LacI family transcriptional regulator